MYLVALEIHFSGPHFTKTKAHTLSLEEHRSMLCYLSTFQTTNTNCLLEVWWSLSLVKLENISRQTCIIFQLEFFLILEDVSPAIQEATSAARFLSQSMFFIVLKTANGCARFRGNPSSSFRLNQSAESDKSKGPSIKPRGPPDICSVSVAKFKLDSLFWDWFAQKNGEKQHIGMNFSLNVAGRSWDPLFWTKFYKKAKVQTLSLEEHCSMLCYLSRFDTTNTNCLLEVDLWLNSGKTLEYL